MNEEKTDRNGQKNDASMELEWYKARTERRKPLWTVGLAVVAGIAGYVLIDVHEQSLKNRAADLEELRFFESVLKDYLAVLDDDWKRERVLGFIDEVAAAAGKQTPSKRVPRHSIFSHIAAWVKSEQKDVNRRRDIAQSRIQLEEAKQKEESAKASLAKLSSKRVKPRDEIQKLKTSVEKARAAQVALKRKIEDARKEVSPLSRWARQNAVRTSSFAIQTRLPTHPRAPRPTERPTTP